MLRHRGQSILEYTMIIGILTVVLFYMGTGIKRGVQSIVKVTADQVGNQQEADQDFNNPQLGYMVSTDSQMQGNINNRVTEIGYYPSVGPAVYISNTGFNEANYTMTNTITNGGFTQTNQ